ncbi:hypothetical protein CPT_Stills95 [Bacillus phage Stills]|uniref:Uncharacterized protein n=1 Tax=Bacillus phage Stills TaxID=1610833 RepID=A0A0E3XA68_9CAUD|nr:hypothetical protein CPT_Stills95 [Bacillus phage Stills]AKC02723.1 hypothetical protein CPT_Stills95 [Bacillus phage Stills]
MGRKVDVVKAYKKLPYEAVQQIDNVLSDENLELNDVDINFLIKEVDWTIEKMDMDIEEAESGYERIDYIHTKSACNSWLKYYGKYRKK